MAEVLPINFPYPTENVIASYDFLDFASGFGYRKLYLANATNATTPYFFLTPQTIESDYLSVSLSGTRADDFDITFSNKVEIQGDAYICSTMQTSGGSSINVTFTLKKVTGAGTTTLASAVTGTLAASTVGVRTVLLDAIPLTSFAPGDILRISASSVVAGTGFYFIDPSGRTSLTESGTAASVSGTTFILLPFKIHQ